MKLLIILLTIFIYSCNINNNKHVISYKKNKIIENQKEHNFIFKDTSYIGIANRKDVYKSEDSSYFITLNGIQQKLEILNLTSKKKTSEVHFPFIENYIKYDLNFDDFFIQSLDSIFLYSTHNSKLALINKEGGILNIWNLAQAVKRNQNDSFLEITTTGLSSFHFDNKTNSIYFKSYPPYAMNTEQEFFNQPFGVVYNLVNNSFEKSFGKWPEQFKVQDEFIPNNFILNYIPVFEDNVYYVSYRSDHNIYKYSLKDDSIIEVLDGKSNFLDEFEFISKTEESQITIDYLTKNGSYNKFIYQKEIKKFYRIVTHNQPLINDTTGRMNNMTFGRNFSIIVFNKDMVKVGEYIFSQPEEYTFFDVIPTTNGLLINYKDSDNENINHFKVIDL